MNTLINLHKDKAIQELIEIKENIKIIKNSEGNKYSNSAYCKIIECIRELQRSKHSS